MRLPGTSPERPAHRFVLSRGARLHLLDWGGEGRPILLLHGVGGHAWMWGHIAPALRALGRPLALDLRGFGDSQWARPEDEYSTDGHVADVLGVADALGLEQLDAIGFSWGGLVALALAARRPALVRRLAVIDIGPSTTAPPDAIPPNFRGAFADHADAVEAERGLAPRAADDLLTTMAAFGTRSEPGGGLVRKLDPRLLREWPFRRDDRWHQLADVRCPTLVVRGGDSPVLPADDAELMTAALPAGRLETIPDAGHLVALEQPERLTALLCDLLSADDGNEEDL